MTDGDKYFDLKIITPQGGTKNIRCDSLHLTLADGNDGRDGGSFGIRKGHANSVLLLAEGVTVAIKDGEEVLRLRTGEGFATAEEDGVFVNVSWAKE